MSYLDLRRWKETIQIDKKMLKFVEEKHVGQIRKGRACVAFRVVLSLANRLGVLCATLNSLKWGLTARAYCYALSGAVGPCQPRARRRTAFPSSYEEFSPAARNLDVWMITGSAGSPIVATIVAPPVVVPSVADPSVHIVTWAFVSRINCKPMFAAIV